MNLVATTTDKAALTAAFVAFTHLPAPEIAGTEPGSVYYAYDPSTSTYWALASFVPTSTASQQTEVALQDGGGMGIFSRKGDSAWTMLSTGFVPFCASKTALPSAVISLWNLTNPQACAADSNTSTSE